MAPIAALVAVGLGAILIGITRYVSLGSIVGAASGGLALCALALMGAEPMPYLWYGLAAAAFIIVSHRDNIERIVSGTERRLQHRPCARPWP